MKTISFLLTTLIFTIIFLLSHSVTNAQIYYNNLQTATSRIDVELDVTIEIIGVSKDGYRLNVVQHTPSGNINLNANQFRIEWYDSAGHLLSTATTLQVADGNAVQVIVEDLFTRVIAHADADFDQGNSTSPSRIDLFPTQ